MLSNPYINTVAVIVFLSLAGILWLAWTAPHGYESDDGFHYGWEDEE